MQECMPDIEMYVYMYVCMYVRMHACMHVLKFLKNFKRIQNTYMFYQR